MSTVAEIVEDIAQAQAEIRRQQEPALQAQRDHFREALRDLALGAQMMLEIPGESSLSRYAREVKRVAEAALRGNA